MVLVEEKNMTKKEKLSVISGIFTAVWGVPVFIIGVLLLLNIFNIYTFNYSSWSLEPASWPITLGIFFIIFGLAAIVIGVLFAIKRKSQVLLILNLIATVLVGNIVSLIIIIVNFMWDGGEMKKVNQSVQEIKKENSMDKIKLLKALKASSDLNEAEYKQLLMNELSK